MAAREDGMREGSFVNLLGRQKGGRVDTRMLDVLEGHVGSGCTGRECVENLMHGYTTYPPRIDRTGNGPSPLLR